MENKLLLSVALSSYNHSQYLKECLDGIYLQQTDFNFELLIYDDLSTDNSREIIQDYINTHHCPAISSVKTLFSEVNLGLVQGPLRLLDNCSGLYTAFIEGDDYWTSPDKLQRQVNFLRSHSDYTLTYHSVKIFNQQKQQIIGIKNREPFNRTVSTEEVIIGSGSSIPTSSIVFLSRALSKRPAWYEAMPIGDYPLFLLLSLRGKVYHYREAMSVYRLNMGSASWSALYFNKDNFRLRYNLHSSIIMNMHLLNIDTQFRYSKAIKKADSKRYLALLTDNYDDSFKISNYKIYKKLLTNYDRLLLFIDSYMPFPRYFKKIIKILIRSGLFLRKLVQRIYEAFNL